METILDRILQQKQIEVAALKSKKRVKQEPANRISLINKLSNKQEMAIIAEFKRASPSKGIINNGLEPAKQAILYEKYGASAISVLTDTAFFKGSFQDLRNVREVVDLPILCKDFMIDKVQIDEAAVNGADIILLIVAALTHEKLVELFHYAKSLRLDVLIEVHNENELESALKTGAKLIGINNRDLKTFHVNLNVTEKLAPLVKASGAYLISESGIHQQADAERVKQAGASGILVGEAFMKSTDIEQAFNSFLIPLAQENVR